MKQNQKINHQKRSEITIWEANMGNILFKHLEMR